METPTACALSLQTKYGCYKPGCSERVSGLVNYLLLAECGFDPAGDATTSALSIICVIVLGLYALIALEQISSVHFAQTIATVVKLTRMSPSIASVTLIAFGNGSSDLFSSLAAFDDGDAQLGLGILLGATFAILTGVLGAIVILMKSIKIEAPSFLRDVVFLVATVVYLWLVLEIRGNTAIGIADTVGLFVLYALYAATFFVEACAARVKDEPHVPGTRLGCARRALAILKPSEKSLELASLPSPQAGRFEAAVTVDEDAEGALDASDAESTPPREDEEKEKEEEGTIASKSTALREKAMHAVHFLSRVLTLPLVPLQKVSIPRAEDDVYHWLLTLLASFGMPLFVFIAIYPGSFLAMPVPRSYGEERSLSGKMFPTLRVIALCVSLPCVIVQAVRIRRCGGCSAQCRGESAIEEIVFDAEEEVVVEPGIVPPPRGRRRSTFGSLRHIAASPRSPFGSVRHMASSAETAVADIAASDGSGNVPGHSCIKRVGVWLRAVPPTGLPRAMLLSMSFIAAVVWIYLIANELIDAIDAVGLMLSVPPDVMGLVVVRACALLHACIVARRLVCPFQVPRSRLPSHPTPPYRSPPFTTARQRQFLARFSHKCGDRAQRIPRSCHDGLFLRANV